MSSPSDNLAYSAKMLVWPLLVDMELYSFLKKYSDQQWLDRPKILVKISKAVRLGWFKLGSIDEDLVTPESLFGINPSTGHYEFLWTI